MIPNLVQNIGETCDNRALLGGGAISTDDTGFIDVPDFSGLQIFDFIITETKTKLSSKNIAPQIINIGSDFLELRYRYINDSIVRIQLRYRVSGGNTGYLNIYNSDYNYLSNNFLNIKSSADFISGNISILINDIEVYNNNNASMFGASQSSYFKLNLNDFNGGGMVYSGAKFTCNNSSLDRFYKMDEMNGLTAFDSSGNDIHGTLQGGASYINTTEFSFRDNYGYSDGTGIYAGVYIPRDESNIKFDVLGDDLEYKGAACDLLI